MMNLSVSVNNMQNPYSASSSYGSAALTPAEETLNELRGRDKDGSLLTPEEEKENESSRIGKKDATDGECQTCKNRKYKDGSNEMVSFKSATHISPEAAASAVRSHEQEHVANAYKKAGASNAKVINASVSIETSVCPECGRTYVSGGKTRTQIKYYNEENPYQQDLKTADQAKYSGMNVNFAV